jgi:Kdo2-lipid IVA lauroyltransferase/acyltransferase
LFPMAWLLAYLPAATGLAVGRRIGDLLWVLLPGRRRVALENLRRGFGSEQSPAALRRLARRSFQHVGMNLVEACRYFLRPIDLMVSQVRVEGGEQLKVAAAQGRGVLIFTAHYGNWELLAGAHGLIGLPCRS